tara:strand:- start:747 stop:1013 length:267 start_codon:yes stop_codon:yes gene_type:complete
MFDSKSVESFKSSLEANYQWPAVFPFKFIVPKERSEQLIELLGDSPLIPRPSSGGRFIAYTMEKEVDSSDEVIALYNKASEIPGIITL